MDLTDPSARGSIQPFAVVLPLAYKAVTDKGADKPQLLVDYNRKQDELVSAPHPPNCHFATNLHSRQCTLRLKKAFLSPQKYFAIKLDFLILQGYTWPTLGKCSKNYLGKFCGI